MLAQRLSSYVVLKMKINILDPCLDGQILNPNNSFSSNSKFIKFAWKLKFKKKKKKITHNIINQILYCCNCKHCHQRDECCQRGQGGDIGYKLVTIKKGRKLADKIKETIGMNKKNPKNYNLVKVLQVFQSCFHF